MGHKLQLIVRIGCSLCEAMQLELEAHRERLDFALELVDVDDSAQLIRDLGDKVPVLLGADGEICHYFLDTEKLDSYFASL